MNEATRPIHEIAREITQAWTNVHYGAVPYLSAMRYLGSITENYGADSGRSVVVYFLNNAKTFRGEDARRLKAELRGMLK